MFRDEVADAWWLSDGFHRVHSARRVGATHLAAMIHYGDLRDAIMFSIRSNSRHGIELTDADKRNKIFHVLTDKEWSDYSNADLAEICRVSVKYFNKPKQDQARDSGSQGILRAQSHPSLPKAIRKQVHLETSNISRPLARAGADNRIRRVCAVDRSIGH